MPITLSLLPRIAPLRWASTMMGLFLLSSLFGNVLSGFFLSAFASQSSNQAYFLVLAGFAAGAGGVLLACKKPLQRAFGSGV